MDTRRLVLAAFACGMIGCADRHGSEFRETDENAGGEGQGGPAISSTTTAAHGSGGNLAVGAGGGSSDLVSEVYGESADVLYRLDPTTKAVTSVGSFDGCSGVLDIALDKDSNLYGTTFDGLYLIDKKTAVCELIAEGEYPNSLSFVPAGTALADSEALVGYFFADYVRMNPTSGEITKIGAIGGGYVSSGDIVSVNKGKTLLTIKGNDCADCIVEVNPKTGDIVKNHGLLSMSKVFGLAFWAGKAYAFTKGGQLFEVSFSSAGVQTTAIPIPSAPSDLSFWGAGSTTSAPPEEIPE